MLMKITCVVAIGRQLEGGKTIHGVPLQSNYTRVKVDEARDPNTQVPLPTSKVQFIGEDF